MVTIKKSTSHQQTEGYTMSENSISIAYIRYHMVTIKKSTSHQQTEVIQRVETVYL